ncbi:hypothetical protein GGI42DRAFT_329170 [Trichoderma sp. SZMC 28013]
MPDLQLGYFFFLLMGIITPLFQSTAACTCERNSVRLGLIKMVWFTMSITETSIKTRRDWMKESSTIEWRRDIGNGWRNGNWETLWRTQGWDERGKWAEELGTCHRAEDHGWDVWGKWWRNFNGNPFSPRVRRILGPHTIR